MYKSLQQTHEANQDIVGCRVLPVLLDRTALDLFKGGVQEALEFLDGCLLIGTTIAVFHNEVIEEFEELLARIRRRSFSGKMSEKELQHVDMRGIVGSLGFRERFNWSARE